MMSVPLPTWHNLSHTPVCSHWIQNYLSLESHPGSLCQHWLPPFIVQMGSNLFNLQKKKKTHKSLLANPSPQFLTCKGMAQGVPWAFFGSSDSWKDQFLCPAPVLRANLRSPGSTTLVHMGVTCVPVPPGPRDFPEVEVWSRAVLQGPRSIGRCSEDEVLSSNFPHLHFLVKSVCSLSL